MPAVSKNQRKAAGIAENAPGKLYGRNKGMLRIKGGALHEYAATKEKGLPKRKG